MKKRPFVLKSLVTLYTILGILLWILAGLFIFTPIIPQVWYAFNPEASENELISLTQSISSDYDEYLKNKPTNPINPIKDTLPPLNLSLSKKEVIKIKEIGVNAELQKGTDSKSALQKGPWIVNNFGTPVKNFSPIIIASHRWGGIGWTKQQRETMSFYKLPSLEKGDIVEIVWNQRIYKYKIYKTTENTKITDYNADLILYTCKMYWESPERIFKYAVRVAE